MIAVGVGVGGIWLLYLGVGGLVGLLRPVWRDRILPWVFVGPALVLLATYLLYPAAATVARSFFDAHGAFTLDNYTGMTTPEMVEILRNNVIWLLVATGGSVIIGPRDRRSLRSDPPRSRWPRRSSSCRWRSRSSAHRSSGASCTPGSRPAQPQIGLLNAIVVGLGGQPIPFFTTSPLNIGAEIVIMIWLQTGFAMVVLSAAIKGVSTEIIEAARLDGANERQLFFRVIVPSIRGSIVTVATTIAIATLKIFDIVYVTTGGRFHDDVVANRMFHEMFQFFNDGRAAALASLLFVAVLPVMYLNLRNFRRQQVEA